MSNLQDDRAASEALKERVQQAEVVYNWRVKHPEYSYDAAISLLKQYHHGEEMTESSLDESAERLVANGTITPLTQDRMESDAARAKRESEESDAQERIELTDFICKARVMQPETEKSERKRFLSPKATDITTLRQIKQNIVAKRELQAKSVEELKTLVRPEPHSIPTDLPSHISAAQILHMWDADQMRHMMARYGSAAITKRVNEGKKERDQ
jgi:hypothetical protein